MGMFIIGSLALLIGAGARIGYSRRLARFGHDDVVIAPHRWIVLTARFFGVLVMSWGVLMFIVASAPTIFSTNMTLVPMVGLGLCGIGMGSLVFVVPDLLTIRGTTEGLLVKGVLIEWTKIVDFRRSQWQIDVICEPRPSNMWSGRHTIPAFGWSLADDPWRAMRTKARLPDR